MHDEHEDKFGKVALILALLLIIGVAMYSFVDKYNKDALCVKNGFQFSPIDKVDTESGYIPCCNLTIENHIITTSRVCEGVKK